MCLFANGDVDIFRIAALFWAPAFFLNFALSFYTT